ncbi:MAG: sigma-70 family RNA polymerase sigma factor [Bacteroidota bacterium]
MNNQNAQAPDIKQLLLGTATEIERAVTFIYQTEKPKIFNALANYCTFAELEEIFDDALLVLMKKAAIIKSCPLAYFRQVCRNKASDLYQSSKRKILLEIEEEKSVELVDESIPLDTYYIDVGELTDFSAAVQLLMNKLGEEDRKVLMRRYVQDWSNQDIAEEENIAKQSVANKLHRCLQKLRRIIAENPRLKETLETQLYEKALQSS